jgi:hypothetical protein
MTNDEIIKMAKDAGAMFDHMTWIERNLLPVFFRFAELVAEKERNECIKIFRLELEKEREACALVADEWSGHFQANAIAQAIRDRGSV